MLLSRNSLHFKATGTEKKCVPIKIIWSFIPARESDEIKALGAKLLEIPGRARREREEERSKVWPDLGVFSSRHTIKMYYSGHSTRDTTKRRSVTVTVTRCSSCFSAKA